MEVTIKVRFRAKESIAVSVPGLAAEIQCKIHDGIEESKKLHSPPLPKSAYAELRDLIHGDADLHIVEVMRGACREILRLRGILAHVRATDRMQAEDDWKRTKG